MGRAFRAHGAHGTRGTHSTTGSNDAAARTEKRGDGFGAGIN